MKLISHRGLFDENIKENTIESIIKAFNNKKYIGVEFDLRVTKDGKFIIYHDPILNGKLINNTNFNELPRYIPKLEQILKINTNKIFFISIKNILLVLIFNICSSLGIYLGSSLKFVLFMSFPLSIGS